MIGQEYDYYSEIEGTGVEWLWYPYIPYGKITLLQGDPGEGKSTFIINVENTIVWMWRLPDGISPLEMEAEDGQ